MKTSKGFFMLKKKLKGYKEITILKKKSEKKRAQIVSQANLFVQNAHFFQFAGAFFSISSK